MENKNKQIFGQILTAVGLTLALGGIASFFSSAVELRFFKREILTDNGKIIWLISCALIALSGILVWRLGRIKKTDS